MDIASFEVTAETFYRGTKVSSVTKSGSLISEVLQSVHTRTNQDMTRELKAAEGEGARQKRSSPEATTQATNAKKRA